MLCGHTNILFHALCFRVLGLQLSSHLVWVLMVSLILQNPKDFDRHSKFSILEALSPSNINVKEFKWMHKLSSFQPIWINVEYPYGLTYLEQKKYILILTKIIFSFLIRFSLSILRLVTEDVKAFRQLTICVWHLWLAIWTHYVPIDNPCIRA